MSNKSQRTIGHKGFIALVFADKKKLGEIEIGLGIASPSEGLRGSLAQGLWCFYCNTRTAINRRAKLKNELCRLAEIAGNLEASANHVWQSCDHAILRFQSRFGGISVSSPEIEEMHPSGVPFIHLLSVLSHAAKQEAKELRDGGGEDPAIAFDNLMRWLAQYHRDLTRNMRRTDFFRCAARVTDLLRNIEKKLRATDFKLPPNDPALRRRLSRLRLMPRRSPRKKRALLRHNFPLRMAGLRL